MSQVKEMLCQIMSLARPDAAVHPLTCAMSFFSAKRAIAAAFLQQSAQEKVRLLQICLANESSALIDLLEDKSVPTLEETLFSLEGIPPEIVEMLKQRRSQLDLQLKGQL